MRTSKNLSFCFGIELDWIFWYQTLIQKVAFSILRIHGTWNDILAFYAHQFEGKNFSRALNGNRKFCKSLRGNILNNGFKKLRKKHLSYKTFINRPELKWLLSLIIVFADIENGFID